MEDLPSLRCGPKRAHKKVRTGCIACKTRHVKCDERRPQCGQCTKQVTACNFPSPKPCATIETTIPPPSQSLPYKGGDLDLNMLDLELIHHWTIFTHDSLTVSPLIRTFWLRNAAQIGFRCDFVMRSLLALSASHLAHLNPAREEALYQHALRHHNTSTASTIASIYHIDQVEDIAMRENLFLYSMFIMFYIISQTDHPQDAIFGRPSRKERSSPDWMVFFHGSRSIALASMALHTTTSLTHPVIGYTTGMLADGERTSKKQYLSTLLARIKATESNAHLKTYMHAAEELEATFAVLTEFPESRDIFHGFLWISNVSDHRGDLIALLQGRDASQEALVIYTYFCKIIQRLPTRWWSEKWVRGLKDGAFASLDEEHRTWVVDIPSWI